MNEQTNLQETVDSFLRTQIAAKVEVDVSEIPPGTKLVDTGLQSIDAVIVCGDAEDEFGVEIDPSELFEHDVIETFAAHIVELIEGRS